MPFMKSTVPTFILDPVLKKRKMKTTNYTYTSIYRETRERVWHSFLIQSEKVLIEMSKLASNHD